MRNTQPAEAKDNAHDGSTLDVHSIFHTIQGEGPYSGRPAIFIRLAGCNIVCPGCDTLYTTGRSPYTLSSIVDAVVKLTKGTRSDLVVLTGGEPLRQPVMPLVACLQRLGYDVQIETNGTLPLYDTRTGFSVQRLPTVVCSPKAHTIHADLLRFLDAMKYVIHADTVSPDDGLPLYALGRKLGSEEKLLARPPHGFDRRKIFIQPEDTKSAEQNARNLQAATAVALRYGYTLQIQLHKTIGVD